MTFEMKLKEAREEAYKEGYEQGFKEGQGEAIHGFLSKGISIDEIAKAFKMTVEEAQDCVKMYLEYLKETTNTETEPNKITYAAMAKAENDKDMYGPYDSVTELMKALNAVN